jgi:hypothetical protein
MHFLSQLEFNSKQLLCTSFSLMNVAWHPEKGDIHFYSDGVR